EQVDHGGRELHAAEAEVVEQALELVGERAHAVRAEEAREPLERVHGAEDVVDEVRIDPSRPLCFVEREEVPPEPLDDLLRFREELVARAVAVAHPRLPSPPPPARAVRLVATASRSASGVNGFARNESAPSASPRARSRSEDCVETIITAI